jgi:predicted kinase
MSPGQDLDTKHLPRVIFVTGPSGSGKTTLTTALAGCLGYRVLSLDEIRTRRKGDTRSAWWEVWRQIRRGHRLVIDATGASRIFRLILRATSYKSPRPLVIRLMVDTTVLREGAKKQKSPSTLPVLLSGGRLVTAEYLTESATYITSDLDIDTKDRSPREVLKRVLSYLRRMKP